jgi:hypothetical protein
MPRLVGGALPELKEIFSMFFKVFFVSTFAECPTKKTLGKDSFAVTLGKAFAEYIWGITSR